MRTDIVFTLTGPDKIGIVEDVTKVLLGLDGNVDTSRMARLGGEFAILMLVSLPAEKRTDIEPAFAHLAEQGYRVSVSETDPARAQTNAGWLAYQVEVQGADHEGIIHDVAAGLSQCGINIESLTTGITRAPMSGTPLFTMTALVMVPPGLADSDWMEALDETGRESGVDIKVSVADQA